MKKTIATFLALPLLLVACGKEKTDPSLEGSWKGLTATNNRFTIQSVKEAEQLSSSIIIYKFKGNSLEKFKAKDTGELEAQVEVERGTYEVEKNVISFNITEHSCTKNSGHPKKRAISYKVSDDQKTLTISGGTTSVTLTRIEENAAESMHNVLAEGETGCFTDNAGNSIAFKPSPIEKPIPVEVKMSVDAIEEEVKKELKDATEEVE